MKFRVFSHAHQVFDEMLERAFIHGLGQLTYTKRWGHWSIVSSENDKHLDMRIVQVLIKSDIIIFVV